MPMITCPDCSKDMSDAAPACLNCGRPNSPQTVVQPKRSVGILLGIGILLVPLLFAWFTLRKGYSTRAKVISFGWVLLTLVIINLNDDGNKSTVMQSSLQTSKVSEVSTKVSAMQVDIRQLLRDYEGNEVAADNRYKGKSVEVTGIVGDIKKDLMSNLYVTLGTGKEFEIPTVQAFFDDSMNAQLGNLRKGQKLTVICTISGLMMNVLGKNCQIK